MKRPLILFFALLFCIGSLSAWCVESADWRIDFGAKANPFDVLKTMSKVSGSDFYYEKNLVRTGSNHGMLLDERTFENGAVTLAGVDHYRSAVEVIARVSESGDAYYSLCVNPYAKTLVFSRFTVNESTRFRHEFEYDGANSFMLTLEFVNGKIIPRCNGKKLGEFEDDGLLKSGRCGIRFGYYSHVELTYLAVQGVDSLRSMKINERVALLPVQDILDWSLENAWAEGSGTRHAVSLNQVWRFQPVAAVDEKPSDADEDWGYIVIPGYWAKWATGEYMRTAKGEAITEWHGMDYMHGKTGGAWHRRTFNVPDEWLDKNLEIRLVARDVCGTLKVFINGQPAGEKSDAFINFFNADITRFLKNGDNEILLFNGNTKDQMAGYGNMRLEIRPKSNFGDPDVSTDVSAQTVTFHFDPENVPAGSTMYIVVWDDENEKFVFENDSAFASDMTFDWLPPVLWSPDTPKLYWVTMTLHDADGNLLDETSLRTGFRQFTVADGQFLLNGHPISLKADTALSDKQGIWIMDCLSNPEFFRAELESLKALNLNCTYLSASPNNDMVEVADELGMMLIAKGTIFGHEQLNSNFEKAMADLDQNMRYMKTNPAFRMHPCIIGLLADVWYNYNAGTVNPAYCGNPEEDPNLASGTRAIRRDRLARINDLYRKYFPDFEVFTGGSSIVGNIYATHMYHTWGAPSAELRSFFEKWAANRKHPIFIGETWLPYLGSFFDLENFRGGGVPYITEQSARILGNEGYDYRTSMIGRPFHDFTHAGWRWNTTENKKDGMFGFTVDAPVAVMEKYVNEIFTGWKFHGIQGWGTFDYPSVIYASQELAPSVLPQVVDYSAPGIKPEAYLNYNCGRPPYDIRNPDGRYDRRPNVLYAPFKRLFANISGGFYGPEADPMLQNHYGFSGDSFEKTAVFFNDTAIPAKGRLAVVISDNQGGEQPVLASDIEVPAFGKLVVPVKFALPNTLNRSEWTLAATCAFGENVIRFREAFQVFGRTAPLEVKDPVYVFDPENSVTDYLKKSVNVVSLESLNGTLPEKGLLVMGRNSFALLTSAVDWNAVVAGGLNVLFMEQNISASPELMKERTRRVFVNAPAHPVFDGLEEGDFCYWNGAASLAPAYEITGAEVNWSDWGNRNMVASYVFRRPMHGNFLSLLTCGFDLFKTPLLEYRAERGRWIASQLDITDRLGNDPVATRVFDNMIRYLARDFSMKTPLFYGGENGRAFLDTFKVSYREVTSLSAETLTGADVLIVSCPKNYDELNLRRTELCDFVYWGGTVLYIHNDGFFQPSWLPFTMDMTTVSASRARMPLGNADGFWQNGFGNSEFYWRENQELLAFTGFPTQFQATDPAVLMRGKMGSGQWVFVSVSPDSFKNEVFQAASGKTIRLFSAMLTDLNVPVNGDTIPFVADSSVCLNLTEKRWEFTTDEKDVGLAEEWHLGKGDAKWLTGLIADGIEVRVGQAFERFLNREYDGVVWYKQTFDVPEDVLAAKQLFFSMGRVDDLDEVYINGVKIGSTGEDTPQYWLAIRNYPIPEGILKATGNLLAVRVTDLRGEGGITLAPVQISDQKYNPTKRIWSSPWPDAQKRDYDLKPDIIRFY